MNAISVSNLSYKYKNNSYFSIEDISLSIQKGKCTGIIGPNGAGKSTLISALTGLLDGYKGQISYADSKGEMLADTVKAEVSLVPQEYAFYPQLTVSQNLAYFASLCHQTTPQDVSDIVSQCQLINVLAKKSGAISGGYKRRLNIAIALVKKPSVLFLDEPTVGIDPESRDVIVTLLSQLKVRGITLVFTSHMLDEVEKLCDDIVVLKDGKVVLNERHDYKTVHLALNTSVPVMPAQFLPHGDKGHYIAHIGTDSELATIFQFLADNADKVKRVDYSAKSVDTMYRQTLEG